MAADAMTSSSRRRSRGRGVVTSWAATRRLHSVQLVCGRPHCVQRTFNGPFSGSTRVSRYQKGKTSLDFTGPRNSEWQWHQLGYMQVCISLQTDNHASTPHSVFLQAGCPSCRPTNSVKALKATLAFNICARKPKTTVVTRTSDSLQSS